MVFPPPPSSSPITHRPPLISTDPQQSSPSVRHAGFEKPPPIYEEVPAKEPDLNMQPKRSALKGSRPKTGTVQTVTVRNPKVPPKPKPKPKIVKMARVDSDKENIPVNASYDSSDDEEIH